MSSKRGDLQRSRPQKHQNKTKFKNDLHDNSTRIKKLNAMSINEVCKHCSEVIQWKIKYRKYKALSQPKNCTKCNQRNVKKAYHVLCRDCAISAKQCAKCLKTEADGCEIIPPEATESEKIKLDIEMKQLIKSLSERKRRTFLRFMRGKKRKENEDSDGEDEESDTEEKLIVRKKPTRQELLEKLETLKISEKDEKDDFYDDINSSDEEIDQYESDD